jgi:eukaryotic-like serine/threonine-protein kinase
VDGAPCVKVLDFGISKMPRGVSGVSFSGSLPTLPSIVMGSPQYMSPEQMVSAASADQRSDIWSLGVTLYQLVTGQIAFDGSSTAEVCARVLQGTPVPLAQLRPDVPGDLEMILSRCLEKDRSRRYANVAEFARALAPLGSPAARASADSIARVFEGGIEARSPSLSDVPTIKPTAAAILAGVPAPRRRGSGYLIALVLALAALGVLGRGILRRIGPLRPVAIVATAAPLQPPEVPAPLLATPVPESPPHAPPAKHHHTSVRESVPPASSGVIAPVASGEVGPYDSPEP